MTVSTAPVRRALPDLGEPRAFSLPEVAERTLSNGLRVLVVRRSVVPLVEVRVRLPFGGTTDETAVSNVLSETLLSGTSRYSNTELAEAFQTLGGDLHVDVDADRLVFAGNALATGLEQFLGLVAHVITDAQYPDAEVAIEREHLADRIEMALARPATAARQALMHRLFGEHPYGVELPEVDQVMAVDPAQLRQLHERNVLPHGGVVILVGDVEPEAAFAAAERAFASWISPGQVAPVPVPVPFSPGPLVLVDRPGSVQSALRLALPGISRAHADYQAFQLANLVFGGYFSSRLVSNIREDKGYTYAAHSALDHNVAISTLLIDADVASDVTAPALHEIYYELGRIAVVPPTSDELEDVRQYAIGTLTLSIETQAGLANMLTMLTGIGLPPQWLADHTARLARVSLDEVASAAAQYLAPSRAISLVVGDAQQVRDSLSALTAVEAIK